MEVSDLDGVQSVDVELESKKATITFDDPATEAEIVELLKEIKLSPPRFQWGNY